MTDEARINLQKGVPENPFYSATTYNIESDLDKWVWQRVKISNWINERRQEAADQKALEEYIEQQLGDLLEKKLDELLEGFKIT